VELDARYDDTGETGVIATLRFVALAAAAIYVAICIFMYLQQRSLQYFPANRGLTPLGAGLQDVSEETLTTSDGEAIVAWFSEAKPGMPTVLFFHGNGGEIGDRAQRMAYYMSQGFGALFVSYRGYGKSSGTVSEKGFVTDAITAHDWLVKRGVIPEQIVVVGESLGTGVSVQLAAKKQISALALEAPYTSAADVAAGIYWWLPVRLLMKDTYESKAFIASIKAPLLVQHGDADRIIPVEQGRSLFAMANEPKELIIIPNEGHDVIHEPAIWAREIAFFVKQLGLKRPAQ